jgi:SMODS and SLOG-associating 2TM effector domain 3/SMODS and SLOG-associating 2TM effector domain 1
MEQQDFPALYRSADSLSLISQRNFFLALVLHLILLVIAACMSVWNSPHWGAAVAQGCVMLGALGCSVYLAVCRPDRHWYAARAVAESIKTLSWRFVSRAEPFHVDDAVAHSEFRNKLKTLVDQNKDVAQKLTAHLDEAQISQVMQQLRSQDLATRRNSYLQKRIVNQLSWYSKKAKWNDDASKIFFGLLISTNIVAVVLSLLRVKFSDSQYWPTDILLAVAACLLTWMQAKRFSELSASYALAAHEISFVREQAAFALLETDFSVFVADAENAFSREHTQWVARRDV